MQIQACIFLGIGDFEFNSVCFKESGIADLATRFCVEGGLVEDYNDRVSMTFFDHGFDKSVLGNDAHDFGFGRGGLITFEVRFADGFVECGQWPL